MSTVYLLNFAQKERTEIVDGVEVCTDTKILSVEFETFISAYTETIGGDYADNFSRFCTEGYEGDLEEDEFSSAPCTVIRSKGMSSILINAKIQDDLEKMVSLKFDST